MKSLTNAQTIQLEVHAKDREVSFVLNYARHQCGMKTARAVATLIASGCSVEPLSSQDRLGFLVDGKYHDWKELPVVSR